MSWAVGSFALALERVCALFLRPTERGRATEGEVGEAALLLLSLDCELPMPEVISRLLARRLLPRGQQQPSPSPSPSPRVPVTRAGHCLRCAVVFARLQAAHAVAWAANGTRGKCSRQRKRRITGEGNLVGTTVVQTGCLQYHHKYSSAQAIRRDEVHWWGSPCTFALTDMKGCGDETNTRLVCFRLGGYHCLCTQLTCERSRALLLPSVVYSLYTFASLSNRYLWASCTIQSTPGKPTLFH